MGPTAERSGSGHIMVALEGDVAELPLLEAAATAGQVLEAPVDVVWVGGGRARPARPLLSELGADAGFAERSPGQAAELLDRDRIRLVLAGRRLWARRAGRLWRRLRSTPLLVVGRGDLPPSRILCGADTPETAARLQGRVLTWLTADPAQVAVVHADPPPPTWAESMCAMYGFVMPPPDPNDPTHRREWGSTHVVDWARPAEAVRRDCEALAPDLVVLGWHRHRLPLPGRWLHPTAWRLSTELDSHVLLVPLGVEAVPEAR